jgi:N-acetylmuramoyl-L-alanine amidase
MSFKRKTYDIEQRSILSEKRLELMCEYSRIHYGLDGYRIEPRMIVVHYTAFETLEASYDFMLPDELSGIRTDIRSGGALNVGTHYLIDRNGDIFQLLDDRVLARHTIGFNYAALSLENVGRDQYHLTQDQVDADAHLVDLLVRRHPTIEYLIGHYEYMDPQKPHYQLMAERDPSYSFTIKQDPGVTFMERLRKTLAGDYGITLKD